MIVFPKLKTAIIESNRTNISILQHHLNAINPEIEICGYAEDIPQAVDLIEKHQPDIIFLDIQLKDGLSFQVADIICQKGIRLGELIFLSSVDRYEYAQKAMEYACLGFILKPITENAVRRATEKATQRCLQRTLFEYIMQQKLQAISEIAVPTEQNSKNLIDAAMITYFEAQGQRTLIHFADCSSMVVARNLGYFKKQLANNPNFFQIHHALFVNAKYIKYFGYVSHEVVLMNGIILEASRRFSVGFKAFWAEFSKHHFS